MMIETTCRKCGATFTLELGEMTREQAEKQFRQMDLVGGQCPGGHVEIGGLYTIWGLDEVLHRAYDLGLATASITVPSDEEHVQKLLHQGSEVVDGGANTVPHLGLPSIHSIKGLGHIGGGSFSSASHLYLRCDSPRGTRFYERVPVRNNNDRTQMTTRQ